MDFCPWQLILQSALCLFLSSLEGHLQDKVLCMSEVNLDIFLQSD